MKLSRYKLDMRGIGHIIVPLVVIVGIGLFGTFYLVLTHAATPTSGIQLADGVNGHCLDDYHSSTASPSTVDTWSCNKTKAQSYTEASATTSTNGGEITNSNGLCLNVNGNSTANGAKVNLLKCSGAKGQLWHITGKLFKNPNSNKCLADYLSGKPNGTKVVVSVCSGSPNQTWTASAITSTTGGGGGTGGGSGTSGGGGSTTGGGGTGGSGGSTSGGCTSGSVAAPCIGGTSSGASGWGTPVFDDEFNGTSLNSTYWNSSWFNGSSMNNVKTSASNVAESGGNLILTLSNSGTGALVSTNPNGGSTSKGFTFTTGYYTEARIFFPGNGKAIYNWPAFWTGGQNWPNTGESDIAEVLGGNLTSNYHSPLPANNGPSEGASWGNGWHTYALNRQNGTDTIYWDGKVIRSYSSDDGGAPQYLIFNVGNGGTTVTGTASQVKVDYVRVWK